MCAVAFPVVSMSQQPGLPSRWPPKQRCHTKEAKLRDLWIHSLCHCYRYQDEFVHQNIRSFLDTCCFATVETSARGMVERTWPLRPQSRCFGSRMCWRMGARLHEKDWPANKPLVTSGDCIIKYVFVLLVPRMCFLWKRAGYRHVQAALTCLLVIDRACSSRSSTLETWA